jgi:transcriptional regulator GlxA family with amidase domain
MALALEHLPENPAIDQIAAVAHMSRRTFYRMFHATTGTTPHRWLLSQRVILARRLLETTQLSVAEIAGRSGFGEVSVLRRHFTSQVGVSPATYRQRFGHPQVNRNTGELSSDAAMKLPVAVLWSQSR